MNAMDMLSTRVWEAAYSLEQSWQDTAEHWQDTTAAEFEQQRWLPLATATAAYLDAARPVEDVLALIRQLSVEDEW